MMNFYVGHSGEPQQNVLAALSTRVRLLIGAQVLLDQYSRVVHFIWWVLENSTRVGRSLSLLVLVLSTSIRPELRETILIHLS